MGTVHRPLDMTPPSFMPRQMVISAMPPVKKPRMARAAQMKMHHFLIRRSHMRALAKSVERRCLGAVLVLSLPHVIPRVPNLVDKSRKRTGE